GVVLLVPIPVGEIDHGGVGGKAAAIARGRDAAVRKFKTQESQSQLPDQRVDLRQRKAVLLHMEQQVTAAAHAVEVLLARDTRQELVIARAEDRRTATPDSLGTGIEAMLCDEVAGVHDRAAAALAVEADAHEPPRLDKRGEGAPAGSRILEMV